MLVYNSKDYHYYNKILNFVDLFPDVRKIESMKLIMIILKILSLI